MGPEGCIRPDADAWIVLFQIKCTKEKCQQNKKWNKPLGEDAVSYAA